VPTAEPPARKRNLVQRFITAAIAVPGLVLLITYVPDGYGLLVFAAGTSLLALTEYFRLVIVSPVRPPALMMYALAAAMWYGAYSFFEVADTPALQHESERLLGYLPLLVLLLTPVMSLALLFDPHTKRPLHTLGLLFIGIFYIIVPFILFYISGFRLGDAPLAVEDLEYPNAVYSWQRPMGILLLIWTTDTFAYFVGRGFGRHKLWPRISPGKTWEGSLGGLVAAVGLSFVLQGWLQEADVNWRIVAVCVGVFGLLGDLVESQFKRSVKTKDSSSLLPGHGGILDRFDGLLLIMPVLAAYFYWVAIQGQG